MNYIFSVLSQSTNELFVYSYINEVLNLEEKSLGFKPEDNLYFRVLDKFSKRIASDKSVFEKLIVTVGFGVKECEQVSKTSKKVRFVYNMHEPNNYCYEPLKTKLYNIHGPVQYVSLQAKAINKWTHFLIKEFLVNFKLSVPAHGMNPILEEFKASFLQGVDHFSTIGVKESNIIRKLPPSVTDRLILRTCSYPTQNGIITMELGDIDSDFVYSFTNHGEYSTIFCYRFVGDNECFSIASIDKTGSISLISPSGINDIKNTLNLIGLLNPLQSGVNLFKKNINTRNINEHLKVFESKSFVGIKHQQIIVQNSL